MAKLVALNLDGTLERGVAVTLEISVEDHPFHTRISGHLPPSPELLCSLNQWRDAYLRLGGDFRIKIKSVESGAIQRQKCDRMSNELSDQFVTWLKADSLLTLNEQMREELQREEPVRVLIRTQDPLLRKLPWHEWSFFERYPLAEYALSSPNAKRIQKIKSAKSEKSVKVLAILGNDDGIDTQTDRQLLDSLANVEFLVKPNRQTINDQLWNQPWDILFFAGHSQTEGDTGRIYINSTEYLTIEQLKYGLQQAIANGLQLAIFNSCDGLGLATELEQLHIPQLIIMREPVPDRVAQTFLRHFLSAYAGGKSLYLAEREAREKLHGMEDEFPCASWLPVIVQNSAELPPTWQSLRRGGRIAGDVWRKRPQAPREMTIRRVLWTSALMTLLVMGVRATGWLESAELLAYDHTMRSRPATDDLVDRNILVVEIDDATVSQFGYPISDATLAQAIAEIAKHNPSVIGVALHRYEPQGEGRTELLEKFQQYSNLFTVCGGVALNAQVYATPAEFSETQIKSQVGFSDLLHDLLGDAVRLQLLSQNPQRAEALVSCPASYSFAFMVAERFLRSYGHRVTADRVKKQLNVGSIALDRLPSKFGGYQSLNGQSNQIMLNYRTSPPGMQVSLQDILKRRVPELYIRDRIVIIGNTADSAAAVAPNINVATPIGSMPHIWVHAHAISQIISQVQEGRPPIWALPQWGDLQWGDSLWILGWSAIAGLLICRVTVIPYQVGISACTVIILYGCCLSTFRIGCWLPLVPTALGILSTTTIVAIYTNKKKL